MQPQPDPHLPHGGEPAVRRIIHVDMDAFYASVEQRDHPELRGRPVVVGGRPESRGVVAAASYEARKFGIRSAMPSARAARLCPETVFVPPSFDRYVEVSHQMREILLRYTPLIEPVALDECYLDVTEHLAPYGSATELARSIKQAIRSELGLTASAGVAPSKFVAKIASDLKKPDGLVVVPPERVMDFLAPQPVRVLWGIGPKMSQKLQGMGIQTVQQLRAIPVAELVLRFGKFGYRLGQLAQGIDPSPVQPQRELKQVSRERTYNRDLESWSDVAAALAELLDELTQWLEKHSTRYRAVHLKVRYADFVTVTRSTTLPQATSELAPLRAKAIELLTRTEAGHRPLRLLGVGIAELEAASPQLELPFD